MQSIGFPRNLVTEYVCDQIDLSRVYTGRLVGPTGQADQSARPVVREFTLADSLPDRSARRSGVRLHYAMVGQTGRPDLSGRQRKSCQSTSSSASSAA